MVPMAGSDDTAAHLGAISFVEIFNKGGAPGRKWERGCVASEARALNCLLSVWTWGENEMR